jgi:cytidyltransferase-like protein
LKNIAINGFFDPLHKGHIIMIQEASMMGELTVILNNDKDAIKKKGYSFLPQDERKLIIENIKGVRQVIVVPENTDNKKAVSEIFREIKCDIFETGYGDSNELFEVCKDLGIEVVYFQKRMRDDGTVCSSSKLVEGKNDNYKNSNKD